LQDLISIGNRVDAAATRYFPDRSNTVPFSQSGTTVGYLGADKTSQIQIGPNQRISSGDTGAAVFMNIQRATARSPRAALLQYRHRLDRRRHGLQRGGLGAGHLHDCVHKSDRLHRHQQHRHGRLDCDNFKDGDAISFNGVQIP